jgi:hypothetical protein
MPNDESNVAAMVGHWRSSMAPAGIPSGGPEMPHRGDMQGYRGPLEAGCLAPTSLPLRHPTGPLGIGLAKEGDQHGRPG